MEGKKYINPTQDTGRTFIMRKIQGSVVMLNLLRFREFADYAANPELDPGAPISGAQAYQIYIEATIPYLKASGGEILFLGNGGAYLIGPPEENWDKVMLIRQHSVESFMEFASNEGYLKIVGHRTAALEDSRLLPITEIPG
jgi:uncharacterized protein (DUF1330 family)